MKEFFSNKSGNMAIIFAMSASVLIGFVGIAIDYGMWQVRKSDLAQAADAAALGAAAELGNGGLNVVQRAQDAAAILGTANLSTVSTTAVANVTIDTVNEQVTVSYTMPGARSFTSAFLNQDPILSETATAKVLGKNVVCLLALNPNQNDSLTASGTVKAEGKSCAFQVNSNAPTGLSNSATIQASAISVVGDYSGSVYSPLPTVGVLPKPDPFSGITIPAPGPCDYVNLGITTSQWLMPGVYCGGLTISAGATATLTAGQYFIVDGPLNLNNGGSLVGNDVVFILSGTAFLNISGNGAFTPTPPSTGPLAGFSIVLDPAASGPFSSSIAGEGNIDLTGIVYLPNQSLELRGQAAGNPFKPSYVAVIADMIAFTGTGDVHITGDTARLTKKQADDLTNLHVSLID